MRYHEGSEYPLYYRAPVGGGAEHVMLDVDAQAQGFDFYSVGAMEVSPDDRLLAYTEDTVSRRQYTVRIRDLATGLDLPDRIPGCESAVAWADDGTTVLYIEQDPATLLGVRVKAHVVGTDPTTDRLVYENTDDRYYLDVRRSRSKRHIFIDLDATDTTETLAAPAGDLTFAFRPVCTRERGHEYIVDDLGDDFIIRTNRGAPNYRVVRVPIAESANIDEWQEIVAPSDDVFIEAALALRDFLVLNVREDAVRCAERRPVIGHVHRPQP
jgi:oligopeptidase B